MKQYDQLLEFCPDTALLNALTLPEDVRTLSQTQLIQLADELRAKLIYEVAAQGGHLAAGLGVVELSVVIHHLYNSPKDKIIWDVGHQAYPHKILTNRLASISTMRKKGGLKGFPSRDESPHDAFGVGHASTSIGAALGMEKGLPTDAQVVAIIGDGAITGGQAYEALSQGGATKSNILVILNDNQMSISENTGGLAKMLAKTWTSKSYLKLRQLALAIPWKPLRNFALRWENAVQSLVLRRGLFTDLGWQYFGPIDGHDVPLLISTIHKIRDIPGPKILHVHTRKGAGLTCAEHEPIKYHALGAPIAPANPADKLQVQESPVTKYRYQDVFSEWITAKGHEDLRLHAITPAMKEGSGLTAFATAFPDRFIDVAIAEQHAITYAAGLACTEAKPVVAIYSTFLQRGYDQLIHDICIQNLDVTFAIDRAGLIGEDGPTHCGHFDTAFLRCLPNMVLACPSDAKETTMLLEFCYNHLGPSAVRYPRGSVISPIVTGNTSVDEVQLGGSIDRRISQKSAPIVLLSFGPLLPQALQVADELDATVVDMRFVKPLDKQRIRAASHSSLLVTLEDAAISGGGGSAVAEFLSDENIVIPLLRLGIPDEWIPGQSRAEMLTHCGLDAPGIERQILEKLTQIGLFRVW